MMNLRVQRRVASAGLVLVTLFGTYLPAEAKINCDITPNAPICIGEPKPKPKPVPPIKDYPAAINLLLQNRVLVEQTIDTVWRETGKGITAQKIEDLLNGREIGKRFGGRAVRLKNVQANLRNITVKEVTPGPEPNQVSLRLCWVSFLNPTYI